MHTTVHRHMTVPRSFGMRTLILGILLALAALGIYAQIATG
jgi:hypothetical protein